MTKNFAMPACNLEKANGPFLRALQLVPLYFNFTPKNIL